MTVQIQAFFEETSSTLSYVVVDAGYTEAVIIDPVLGFDYSSGQTNSDFADQLINFLKNRKLTLSWILETHAHADHLSAAQYIKQKLGGKVAIGKGILKVQNTFRPIFELEGSLLPDGADFDHLFEEHEQVYFGQSRIDVICTPGHTNDSITYLIEDNAFVGDSLFMPDGGSARCDFPGGSAAVLYDSVQKLYELGDQVKIHVCHDYQPSGRELKYVATVAEHKANNIHLNKLTNSAEFVQTREHRDAGLDLPKLIIPSIQINICAGKLPTANKNGIPYLKLPLNTLNRL